MSRFGLGYIQAGASFTPFVQDVTPAFQDGASWSQSVTIPSGATTVDMIVIAQGGKGGASNSADAVGGSGGSGGASSQTPGFSVSGLSALYLYITTGSLGISGIRENNSSGTIRCSAQGGRYGIQDSPSATSGGQASAGVGTTKYSGGAGAAGVGVSPYVAGGGGAASLIANGGNAPAASNTGTGGTSTAPGGAGGTDANGNAYGGGGAGRSKDDSTSVVRLGGGALFRLSWS